MPKEWLDKRRRREYFAVYIERKRAPPALHLEYHPPPFSVQGFSYSLAGHSSSYRAASIHVLHLTLPVIDKNFDVDPHGDFSIIYSLSTASTDFEICSVLLFCISILTLYLIYYKIKINNTRFHISPRCRPNTTTTPLPRPSSYAVIIKQIPNCESLSLSISMTSSCGIYIYIYAPVRDTPSSS